MQDSAIRGSSGNASSGSGGATTARLGAKDGSSTGFGSFRTLVNRDGTLPRDDLRWSSPNTSTTTSAASSLPPSPSNGTARLVEVVGLDRGRLNFEGVILNSLCSLRKLGLRNVSGGTVVVRLGSTVGDQLRWQLRNDNLNVLPQELQHIATNSVAAISRLGDLPESNAMFDTVGLISEVTLQPGETKDIVAAFRPDSTHFHPSIINYDPSAANKVDSHSEQGLSSISIAESSMSSSAAAGMDSRAPTAHNLATIDGYVNLDASLIPADAVATPSSTPATSPAAETIPNPFLAVQQLSIEFHATCCRSFFTLSAKDSESSSTDDEVSVDFGTCRVGELQTRDCEISNRSAVELFWRIDSLPNSFQVEDSEGVLIGAGGFASVAPYSNRKLKFLLRALEPSELDVEMTFENIADPDNIVQVHFHGIVTSAPLDNTLKIVSGASLDFGDCCAGEWNQQVVAFTNISGAPLEVSFTAEKGYDVTFRLETGNAGDPQTPFDLDRAAIGANAVEFPLTPSAAEPAPARDPTNPSRTIIHELARGTTNQQRGLLSAARPLLPFTAPRSPRSVQSDQTFGSSDEIVTESNVSSDASAPRTYHPNTVATRDFRSPLGVNSAISSDGSVIRPYDDQLSLEEIGGSVPSDQQSSISRPAASSSIRAENSERGLFRVQDHLKVFEQRQSATVDQLYAKPGVTYRITVSFRPARASTMEGEGGRLVKKSFKCHVSWRPWGTRGAAASVPKERKSIACKARVCSSFISVNPSTIDFGEVELGTSVQGTISITNLSEITARVDLRFISKVLSAYRDEIEIGVGKTVDVKVDMVPRRTNPSYQKQVSVHNLLNPDNSQVCLIKAANVDTRGVAFHSLFYRLLTPTGGNFLEFGNVPINSSALRAITIQNTSLSALSLDLSTLHPADYQLFVRKTETPPSAAASIPSTTSTPPSPTGAPAPAPALLPKANGELKERVLDAIFQQNAPAHSRHEPSRPPSSASSTTSKAPHDSLGTQLKEGDKGKATQTYGSSVAFRDRGLLANAEYLDLATGPPAARRASPRGKRTLGLDPAERSASRHRPSKLSFHPRATTALKSPVTALEDPFRVPSTVAPSAAPSDAASNSTTASKGDFVPATPNKRKPKARQESSKASSPALSARRRTRNVLPLLSDPSKLSLDEALTALEHHSAHPDSTELSSWELEDAYVKRYVALRRALKTAISSGELVEAASVDVSPQSEKTIYVLAHPTNTRANVQSTSRKQDGKISIHLRDFGSPIVDDDPSTSLTSASDIPVREVVLRWTTCRSTMDLGMVHINFGQLEKSSSKTKKIVIANASEMPLLYAVRKSGSIASGDIRLAEGRHGVISGYGKREVSIIFEPHFAGAFEETIHVDNVEDETEGQTVRVKAFILRPPTFSVSTTSLDFGDCALHSISKPRKISITNISKSQRTFSVALDSTDFSFARAALDVVLDPSATTSKVRGPLTVEEEEEVEGVLQKLKISRRKGQPEKEEKYISRLNLLGVPIPANDSAPAAPPAPPAATEEFAVKIEAGAQGGGSPNGGQLMVVSEATTPITTAPQTPISTSPTDPLSVAASSFLPTTPTPTNGASSSLPTASPPSKPKAGPTDKGKSSVTFTLDPNSRRELAIVIIPRPVLPALADGKLYEDVLAPITVAENADSKTVVTLTARVALDCLHALPREVKEVEEEGA